MRLASREVWRDDYPVFTGKQIAERTCETVPHQDDAPAVAGDLYGGFWQKSKIGGRDLRFVVPESESLEAAMLTDFNVALTCWRLDTKNCFCIMANQTVSPGSLG